MCVIGYTILTVFLIENTILISAAFFFFLSPLYFNLFLVSCTYGNRQAGLFGKQIDVSIL